MSDTPVETPTTPVPETPKPAPRPGEPLPPEPTTEAAKPVETDRLAALEAQTKRAAYEGMQRAKELKRQREELAKDRESTAKEKLEMAEWRKEQADRKRNPQKWLERDFGPNWRDAVAQVALTNAPTTDLIASEVEDRFSSAEKSWQEKFEALQNQLTERDTKAAAQAEAEYHANARAFVRTHAEKYPLIHAFEVVDNITAVISQHFASTTRTNEDGETVPGEVLTAEQAADMMEKHLEARLASADKAKAAKAAKANPAPVTQNQRTESPQRRSLSTDLGGTSRADRPPPMTEAERMRRALAAIDALGSRPN